MQRFLVLQAARFGDLVQTKRLVSSLEQQGEVSLLVDRGLAPLAHLIYPRVQILSAVFHGTLEREECALNEKTFALLAGSRYDTVFNCNFSGLTSAICRLFASEQVVGWRPKRFFSGADTFSSLERSPLLALVSRMTTRRNIACLNLEDVWAHFLPDPLAPSTVNPLPEAGGRGVGVVLAGREMRRSLPPPLLADLISIYAHLYPDRPIYFFGTEREKSSGYLVRRSLPPVLNTRVQDLCAKTDWAGLIDALRGLDVLLSPDTGTMHLAAHLGVPVRAFFLSSALCHETGPYGAGHRVWQAAPLCAPCLEKAACTNDMACCKVLMGRNFLRAVTRQEQGLSCEAPQDVQCFAGDFDELGLVMKCCAGLDPQEEDRRALRRLLTQILCLGCARDTPSASERRLLETLLLQDTDFMLPTSRYR